MKNILIYDHSFLDKKILVNKLIKKFTLHGSPHLNCQCEFCLLKKNNVINLDFSKKFKFQKFDYRVQEITEINLKKLINFLNSYHKANLNYRSWKLILWPWLLSLTATILEIKTKLESQNSTYNSEATICITDINNVIPDNYIHFTELLKGQYFHDYILSIIAKKYFSKLHVKKKNVYKINKSKKSIIMNLIRFLFHFFTRKSKYILISSYLPLMQRIKISLKSKSIPIFSFLLNENFEKKNKALLELRTLDFKDDDFYIIARLLIPYSYLENFRFYYDQSLNVFPPKPKLIYTANAYINCDLFKIWTAHKLKDTRFIIAQHGGHYGVGKTSFYNQFEYQIPDYFFSWGWVNKKYKKIIPIGNWSKKIKQDLRKDKSYLYIIGSGSDKYICSTISMPLGNQWKDYILNIRSFINNLNIERDQVVIRPYHANITWESEEIYKKNFHDIKIENINNKIENSIAKARLVICTWNSTNFLHLLSSNIPTITFWDNKHFDIEDEAKPYLNNLLKVNILHYKNESSAKFVNKIWNNVDDWWLSKKTQNARKMFIEKYCSTENFDYRKFKNLIYFTN